jgi:hypothetical protein
MSYLVFPAARWMTGAAVRMDGGEIKPVICDSGLPHNPAL